MHQEKVQQEKLKAVKVHLNFEETSHHSESGTPTKEGTTQGVGHTTVATGTLKAATKVPDQEQRIPLLRDVITKRHPREERRSCQKARVAPKVIKSQKEKGRSRALRTTCPNHGYVKKHILSLLGSVTLISQKLEYLVTLKHMMEAKMERWAMPTWCHMFNSTLTGNARVWFDDLPKEIIDSYDDLKKAFLENYLQQKKCIKDPVEIHNIRQREGESTEEFVRRYKLECRDVKGAPECMKISEFMHMITNPELIKRLHDKIPKLVDGMMGGNYNISPGRSSRL
ncbi:reverse transcriptase domain-containing protein [Tanacetum coccineum]